MKPTPNRFTSEGDTDWNRFDVHSTAYDSKEEDKMEERREQIALRKARTKMVQVSKGIVIIIPESENPEEAKARFLAKLHKSHRKDVNKLQKGVNPKARFNNQCPHCGKICESYKSMCRHVTKNHLNDKGGDKKLGI